MALKDVSEHGTIQHPNDTTKSVRTRVIEATGRNARVMVDVRTYVESEGYTGWTKMGLSLPAAEARQVIAHLTAATKAAEAHQKVIEKRAKDGEKKDAARAAVPSAPAVKPAKTVAKKVTAAKKARRTKE